MLDLVEGLVGDTWSRRRSSRSADGLAHPEMQLNVMNACAASTCVSRSPARFASATSFERCVRRPDLSYVGPNFSSGAAMRAANTAELKFRPTYPPYVLRRKYA